VSLSRILVSERVSDFGYLWILEYLYWCIQIYRKQVKNFNFIFNNCWKQTDVWCQTRASGCTIVNICCAVASQRFPLTSSWHLKTFGFQSISDKGYRTVFTDQKRIMGITVCLKKSVLVLNIQQYCSTNIMTLLSPLYEILSCSPNRFLQFCQCF
jgi:hypothetical protein